MNKTLEIGLTQDQLNQINQEFTSIYKSINLEKIIEIKYNEKKRLEDDKKILEDKNKKLEDDKKILEDKNKKLEEILKEEKQKKGARNSKKL